METSTVNIIMIWYVKIYVGTIICIVEGGDNSEVPQPDTQIMFFFFFVVSILKSPNFLDVHALISDLPSLVQPPPAQPERQSMFFFLPVPFLGH